MKSHKAFVLVSIVTLLAIIGSAADKKLTKSQLPAAVQKAAEEQSKGAKVVGYSSEKEKGKTLYEVAMKVDNHTKDVIFDETGKLVEVEEEVAVTSLPSGVQESLKKAAGRGKLGKVESLTKDGKLVAYEAIVTRRGKKSEIQVGPNGEKLDHEE